MQNNKIVPFTFNWSGFCRPGALFFQHLSQHEVAQRCIHQHCATSKQCNLCIENNIS